MTNIVGRSVLWGAIFGATVAFAASSCLAIIWSTGKTGHPGDFPLLMILWVPPVTIMGAGAAAVLFGVVAVIVNFTPARIKASLSYAALAFCRWESFCHSPHGLRMVFLEPCRERKELTSSCLSVSFPWQSRACSPHGWCGRHRARIGKTVPPVGSAYSLFLSARIGVTISYRRSHAPARHASMVALGRFC
jgi:hypothetical protein